MREPPRPRAPQQQLLFRVIPIDTIAAPQTGGPTEAGRPGPRRTGVRTVHPDQEFLPFAEAAENPASAPATPAVECDAPVASIRSRCKAAAVDLAFVLAAGCVFFGGLLIAIGPLPADRLALLLCGGAFALILVFYRLLEIFLSDRSPGMRLAGLRLLHFHGRPASRQQRLLRLAACVLSLIPAGIGFWWALLDEERLTFHDQISGTFPSPDRRPC
ncbi:MAG: RDD family protein [Bryobacteraceae bacterium]